MKAMNLNHLNNSIIMNFGDDQTVMSLLVAVTVCAAKGIAAPAGLFNFDLYRKLLRKYTPFCGLLCLKNKRMKVKSTLQ